MEAVPRSAFSIGWICALHHELAASRVMLDQEIETSDGQDEDDYNVYVTGRLKSHYVVIACLPAGRTGKASAATVAVNMLRSFKSIKIGLMVGIGGAVPDNIDIRLGDVVVGQPSGSHGGVQQYDMGKRLPNGAFEVRGHLSRPPNIILTALQSLKSLHETEDSHISTYIQSVLRSRPKMQSSYGHPGVEHDKLFVSECEHGKEGVCQLCGPSTEVYRKPRLDLNGNPDLSPHLFYGLIGSGDSVVGSSQDRKALANSSNLLCFEMEAAGIVDTGFPCLVVRGMSDYSDSYKQDKWQKYAAMTAAAYAKELVEQIPSKKLADTRTAVDRTVEVTLPLRDLQSPSVADFRFHSAINSPASPAVSFPEEASTGCTTPVAGPISETKEVPIAIPPIKSNYQDKFEERGKQEVSLHREVGQMNSKPDSILSSPNQTNSPMGCRPLDIRTNSMTENASRTEHTNDESRELILEELLLQAVSSESEEQVSALLQKGADCNASPQQTGSSPLHCAAASGSTKICSMLLAVGVHTEARNESGETPLFAAVKSGNVKMIDLLVSHGAVLNVEDKKGITLLHRAVAKGNTTIVERLIYHGVDIMSTDQKQNTALHMVSRNSAGKSTQCAKLLVDKSPDIVDARNAYLKTPLHLSTQVGNLALMEILINGGADVNAVDLVGKSAFWYAMEYPSPDPAELLLRNGASVHLKAEDGLSLLHMAARHGNMPAIEFLLRAGSKINDVGSTVSVIDTAAEAGQADVVECFLKQGAKLDTGDVSTLSIAARHGHVNVIGAILERVERSKAFYEPSRFHRPLMEAISHGHEEAVDYLLKIPGFRRIDYYDLDFENSPVSVCIDSQSSAILQRLVSCGFSVSAPCKEGMTPLTYSAKTNAVEMIRPLLNLGAPIDARDADGHTALQRAVACGNDRITEMLLTMGASPTLPDDLITLPHIAVLTGPKFSTMEILAKFKIHVDSTSGSMRQTPLIMAAARGQLVMVEQLINAGASIEVEDLHSKTALHHAVEKDHMSVVQRLLESGASVKSAHHDRTPLHYAAESGNIEVARALLLHSPELEARDAKSLTPLHVAVQSRHVDMVKELISADAEIEAETWGSKDSVRPLHFACKGRVECVEIVQTLLSHDACIDALNIHCQTPLHFAVRSGFSETVRLLIAQGADPGVKDTMGRTPLDYESKSLSRQAFDLLVDRTYVEDKIGGASRLDDDSD